MSVYPLTGVVRPYAWGSRTALAELQGRPAPTDEPEAELWLGAHPDDPSTVTVPDGPVSLAALIAADPKGQLGESVAAAFGPRLPFLLKVLAAQTPLSLQAHPSREYAIQAYARQEADPTLPKNYTDGYHKPEMLVALTPFEALCGFRDPAAAADVLASLDIPALAPVVGALRDGDLRTAVQTLLSWPEADRPALTDAVVVAARRDSTAAAAGAAAAMSMAGGDPAFAVAGVGAVAAAGAADAFELAADLAGRYPGDPGVLVALLLNHVRLKPGEAIWMPAGNLHAYLCGTGVELMAASDNVLRGGLTPKRVDVAELLNVLRFEVLDDPILPSGEVAPGVVTWQVPVPDFAMYRIDLDGTRPPTEVPAQGPRIILTTVGDVFVGESVDGTPIEIPAGSAAYASADAGAVKVAGTGTVFVAAVRALPLSTPGPSDGAQNPG